VDEGLGDEEGVAGDGMGVEESETMLGDGVELGKKFAEGVDEPSELGVGDDVVEICSALGDRIGTDELITFEDAAGVDELGEDVIKSDSRLEYGKNVEEIEDSELGEGDGVDEPDSRLEDEEAADELGASLRDKNAVEEPSSTLENEEGVDRVGSRRDDGEVVDELNSTSVDGDDSGLWTGTDELESAKEELIPALDAGGGVEELGGCVDELSSVLVDGGGADELGGGVDQLRSMLEDEESDESQLLKAL
jgi:hypothetical protein